jgi:hypothetical protein
MKHSLQEEGIWPLCYICFLKSKGFYKSAIKNLKNTDCWSYQTKWDFEIGWTFIYNMQVSMLLAAVMNCGSLNKTPKLPELMVSKVAQKLHILGFSVWQISVFFKKYPKYA